MKAMLYADWAVLKQIMRQMLIVFIVLTLAAVTMESISFIYMLTIMLMIMVPMTLFAPDPTVGWERYSLSMPVCRKDIVWSKFAMSALFAGALTVLAVLVTIAFAVFGLDQDFVINIAGLLCCQGIGLLLSGVVMCMTVRWGTEKARYLFMAVVWTPILLGFVISKMDLPEIALVETIQQASDIQILGASVIALVVGVLLDLMFGAITVRIYKKKEF